MEEKIVHLKCANLKARALFSGHTYEATPGPSERQTTRKKCKELRKFSIIKCWDGNMDLISVNM